VLRVAGPGEEWRIFSTDEFRLPPNPEDWNWSRDRSAENHQSLTKKRVSGTVSDEAVCGAVPAAP
jgi:hypothetical protein